MPEETSPVYWEGWTNKGLQGPMHGRIFLSDRGAVNHQWDTGVGEHFNLPGHDLANFNFLPFEKVRSSDPFVIETRESYWIEKYEVLGEGGMNRRS